jgi:two-component system chemotaxis response regulator CheB
MPQSALENVEIDYCVPVVEMSNLLEHLVTEPIDDDFPLEEDYRLGVEVKIAKELRPTEKEIQELGDISEFTCPECHGSLWQMYEGKILRFRCRTGHAYSAEALLEDMTESVEAMEWAAIRGIEESAVLMEHMAHHLAQQGERETAQRFQNQAARTRVRSDLVRQAIVTDDIPQLEPGSGTAPI